MRRWLLCLLLILACVSLSEAAITRVGSGKNACSSTTTCSVTYSPTANNFVRVATQNSTAVTNSVTDNASGGSTTYTSVFSSGGSSEWYVCQVKSGVTSITVNIASSATQVAVIVEEYSGLAASGCLDQVGNSGGATTGSSTTATSANITTTRANEVLVGWFETFGGPITFTASGAGWGNLVQQDNGALSFAVDSNIVSSIQTAVSANATISGTVSWGANIISYQVAAGTTPGQFPRISRKVIK